MNFSVALICTDLLPFRILAAGCGLALLTCYVRAGVFQRESCPSEAGCRSQPQAMALTPELDIRRALARSRVVFQRSLGRC